MGHADHFECAMRSPRNLPIAPLADLEAACRENPWGPAVVTEGGAWTYSQLHRGSLMFADHLTRIGINRGDRVVLHMANRPELLALYYACLRLGAIACPTNIRLTPPELTRVFAQTAPRAYAGDSAGVATFRRLGDAAKGSVVCIDLMASEGSSALAGPDGWGEQCQDVGGRLDDVAVLLSTSGSTGEPKYVAHTAGTLAATASLMTEGVLPRFGPALLLPSWVHAFGLFSWLALVRLRVAVVGRSVFDPRDALTAIDEHQCRSVVGLPFMFATMDAVVGERGCPDSVASLVSSGDTLPTGLQRRIEARWGAPLRQFWASTEVAGALTCGGRPGPLSRVSREVGVRLVAAAQTAGEGSSGELWITSPSAFAGYWDPAERSVDRQPADRWVKTGDFFTFEDDGELRFLGRIGDIIVRGGSNVSPVEVENVLRRHPGVVGVAVTSLPDDVYGETIVAYVQTEHPASDRLLEDLYEIARGSLSAHKIPAAIRVIDDLPVTAIGKVDRAKLRELARCSEW